MYETCQAEMPQSQKAKKGEQMTKQKGSSIRNFASYLIN
jgi:hypothetical protein